MGRGGESGILRNLKAQILCAPRGGDDARGRERSTQAEQSKGQKDKINNKGVNPDQSPFFCRRTKSSLRRLFPSVSPVGMEVAKEEGGCVVRSGSCGRRRGPHCGRRQWVRVTRPSRIIIIYHRCQIGRPVPTNPTIPTRPRCPSCPSCPTC